VPNSEATGGVTALFGPSGAQVDNVSMIAGLLAPDRGRISLDDEVLFDSSARKNVSAHHRCIGYVFQEGRLFRMTVAKNLEYGRWMGGLAPDPAETERIVALLDIGSPLRRRPGRLSRRAPARRDRARTLDEAAAAIAR
jgi:molybdate transport system ATP-binding protein